MAGFTTRRLVAVPVTLDDRAMFERLWGDDRVAQTLGGTRDPAQVHDDIVAGVEHWKCHGHGRWVLWPSRSVGTVKLTACDVRGRPEVELGYALLPEFWGLGYATEAATGALQHAAAVMGLSEVIAFALPENQLSLAVMRKLGFKDEQRVVLGGREHILGHCHLG